VASVDPEPEAGPARRPRADVTATTVTAPVTPEARALPVRTPILDAVAQAGGLGLPGAGAAALTAGAAAAGAAAAPSVSHPVAPEIPPVRSRPSTPVPAPAAAWPPRPPSRAGSAPAGLVPRGAPARSVAPGGAPSAAAVGSATPTAGLVQPARQSTRPSGTTAATPTVVPTADEAPGSPLDEPGSPLDLFDADVHPRRWPRALATILSIVVVLGGIYVGACYAFAGKVARGASVAGVEIGGMSKAAAIDALDKGLANVTTQPITVTAGEVTGTVDPVAAGLTFDATATVARLTGVDLHPARLWHLVFGIGSQPAVTHVDDTALAAAVDALDTTLAVDPIDGAIVFADGAPHVTAAVDGSMLDTAAAANALRTQWLTAARPLVLATQPVEPDVTQAETDAAMKNVATKVTSGAVSVQVGGQLVELPPAALATVASFVPASSDLVLQIDGPKLVAEVLKRTTNLLTPSADAHFEFQNDAPVVVPGTTGTTLDPTALAAAVSAAIMAPVRTATVALVASDPAQSTQKLQGLGVTTNVAEFSTPLTAEPKRTVNITNGANKVNGTLVLPGATFSLTEALGPITTENGYIEAGVLLNGEHQEGMGGGLSQMATTTYNAGFLAGYEDIEHRPHTEWFSRYPEGREATIYTGVLDMKWKNNTPYGALIQSWVADGRVWVRLWSTKYWTVESTTSPRTDVVPTTTVYSQSPTCGNQAAGSAGFKVSVTRTVSLDGVVKETKTNSWRYKPSNKIICGTAPTTP